MQRPHTAWPFGVQRLPFRPLMPEPTGQTVKQGEQEMDSPSLNVFRGHAAQTTLREDEHADPLLIPDPAGQFKEQGDPERTQPGAVTALESMVTAPDIANALPFNVARVAKVTEAVAMIVPLRTEEVPSVAEDPTCQKMFLASAPPVKTTLRPEVRVKVDPIWKIHTAFALPCASRTRSPDETASDEEDR
jgi:hypothetical protein